MIGALDIADDGYISVAGIDLEKLKISATSVQKR